MADYDAALEATVWFLLTVAGALVIPLLIGGVLYWRERFKTRGAPPQPAAEPAVPKQLPTLPREVREEDERLESVLLLAALQLENSFTDAGAACFSLGESPNERLVAIRHALKAIAADSGMMHVALQLPEGGRPDIIRELWNIMNARGAPSDPRTAEVHRLLTRFLEQTIAFLDAAEALELYRNIYVRYR